MKFLRFSALAAALAFVFSAPTALAGSPIQTLEHSPAADEQSSDLLQEVQAAPWICYAENSYGTQFYWIHGSRTTACRQVMRACQLNTPVGAVCTITGYERYYG